MSRDRPELPFEDHLGLLASVSQAFASSLDIEQTLQTAVTQITGYMHAEGASLFLLENEDTELVCRACAGPVDLVGLRLRADQGIVGKTVREDAVQFIRDVGADPDFAGFVDEKTGFETRSILCAPLSVKGTRIGALEIINKDTGDGLFESSDQHMLQVLASSASLVIHNARMASALVEQERIQRELELARQIQSNLLPAPRGGSFPVYGINIPAREVSGDFFDYFYLADGRIGFNLGDVAGKGMNAALLMAKTSSLLHCLGKSLTDPGALLAKVNDELCESAILGMFVTVVAGVYDPRSARVILANAGHLPPLYRSAQGAFSEIGGGSPPLGVVPGMSFESRGLNLAGGSLYLYTDGVTEGAGTDGKPLEVQGLQALLETLGDLQPARRLRSVVERINAGEPARKDDVTLLVVEQTAMPEGRLLELRCASSAEQLHGVREALVQALESVDCDPQEQARVVLAVNEACMNVIQHAYHGDPEGEMILEILNNDGELEFRLTDFGDPVDSTRIKPRQLSDIRPGGLGTHFIREIMDEVSYGLANEGPGNLLIMKKRYKKRKEASADAL